MNITMAMIFDGLSKRYECIKGDSYDGSRCVECVVRLDEQGMRAADSSLCYVASSEDEAWGSTAFGRRIVVGASEGREDPPFCAIAVKGFSDSYALKNAVLAVMNEYENWAEELLDLCARGSSLDAVVDQGYSLLGNPIEVLDQDFRVYAQTEYDTMDDNLWIQLSSDERRTFADLLIDAREKAVILDSLREIERVGFLEGFEASTGVRTHVCKVPFDDGFVVAVLLEKNRRLTEGDLHCLMYFSSIVGSKLRAIGSAWSGESRIYLALLHDVVKGELTSVNELKALLGRSRVKLKSFFTVLAVSRRDGMLKHHQLCQIDDDLAKLIPGGCGIVQERKLLVFLNHDGEGIDSERKEQLVSYADGKGLIVGVSDSAGEGCSLSDLVAQAHLALRVGERKFPEKSFVGFSECKRYGMLDACSRQEGWRRYLHPSLALLGKRDGSEASCLLPTLSSFASNRWNKSATAQELGVRRNTLQGRLDKIESICGIDLSDTSVLGDIAFSLELLDYCGESSPN